MLSLLAAFAAPRALAQEVVASAPEDVRLLHRGLALTLDAESGTFGLATTAQVGFELKEVRALRHRTLLFVGELAGGPAGGEVANSASPMTVLGARAKTAGELDYRFLPERAWSPVAGGGGSLAVQAIAVPSLGFGSYQTVNSLDGLAGVNGAVSARLLGGASFLRLDRAFQASLFVQESFRAPATIATGTFFNELGAHAELEAWSGFWLRGEALIGRNRQQTERHFHSINQLTHQEADLSLRKDFQRLWLAFDVQVAKDSKTASFPGSSLVFHTAGPIVGTASLGIGMVWP